ncbi:MAG: PIN domain-containing protein [Actinobacteria bacterium]|nr:PIN domain-containing protein [Actinomycetota bacterium]MCL5882894.1 PIN domain-containing protein [Actinomycetota bacterium]
MKSAVQVLDASALLAYLKKEPGYAAMVDILRTAESSGQFLLINEINLGEVYYILAREKSLEAARTFIFDILPQLAIAIEKNAFDDIIDAAEIKARLRVPYVDAFAAALTRREAGILLTCDSDFRKVEKEIRIHWLRQPSPGDKALTAH